MMYCNSSHIDRT
ncbi:unnamed protein product [Acanthoscelides obtectus]|uniref:Uncharacterized protein n=1 Tax=Acanthoscelides obtectus TaxID=200917 RepID=A0A9P0K8X3_ACAOB|nr:unnamed protein product [Acanthoscelides obtectus]CAK1633479.1 hypothetical protein AOBTE_LOCUS8165 [Acanthoscelides obtectus]